MLVGEQSEAILPPIPGEQGTLSTGRLAVKVHLRGPPSLDAILEFCRRAQEPTAAIRFPNDVLGRELQVSRFLHLVRIGDEEWPFSRRTL
jgi:hypothetical protein